MIGELVDAAAPAAETGATRDWPQPASSSESPQKQSARFISVTGLQGNSLSSLCNCGATMLAVAVARQVFQVTDDQRGPAGLMVRAQAFAGFAMEIFVEQNQVAPVRVSGPARVVPVTG